MSLIANLFGRSPVRPMQEHMQVAVTCARETVGLVEAMAAGDTDAVVRQRDLIEAKEHEADRIKNEIRSHLPKRLFMAMERRDMLEILDQQDSIADVAQDIAGLAVQRDMRVPEAFREPLLQLVRRSVAACEAAQRVIGELDELVETGFGGREVARVEEIIDEVGRIESETDELSETVHKTIFAMEEELGIGTVFWYQWVGWIAKMADHAERVANRLRLLIAH